MPVAGWLWSAMLMTSLAITSSRRDITEELRIAVVVPYDERRLFSRRKILPAVSDALHHHNVTDKLVPRHRFIVYEADSGCNSTAANIAAIQLHYERKVSIVAFMHTVTLQVNEY